MLVEAKIRITEFKSFFRFSLLDFSLCSRSAINNQCLSRPNCRLLISLKMRSLGYFESGSDLLGETFSFTHTHKRGARRHPPPVPYPKNWTIYFYVLVDSTYVYNFLHTFTAFFTPLNFNYTFSFFLNI